MSLNLFRRLGFDQWMFIATVYLCAVAGVMGLVSLLVGCQLLSQGNLPLRVDRLEQVQAALALRVEKIDAAVISYRDSRVITNDPWPWLLSGLTFVVVVGSLFLVRKWIRIYSYLHQKPIYEKARLLKAETPGSQR